MASATLSKSKIIAGLQCPKRLWLQVHRLDLLEQSAQTQQSYDIGNELGRVAQALYPGGKLIGHVYEPSKAVAETKNSLFGFSQNPLFEAAFSHKDVLVRVDLVFNEIGGLRVVEVKSASSVKGYYLKDCAIQSWVIENAGYPLKQFELAHVNSSFVYQGDGDYQGLLIYKNITEQIEPFKPLVKDWVVSIKNVLDAEMPDIQIGNHCYKPFACQFNNYCNPNPPEFPVKLLSPRKKFMWELQDIKIYDVRGVPKHSE